MGIRRTVETRILQPPSEALASLRSGAEAAGMDVGKGTDTGFSASSKRSLRKNRWAAELAVEVRPAADGTLAEITVDMNGTKHLALVNEVTEPLADRIDDRGLNQAKERLGKPGRVFGVLELRALSYLLRGDERVVTLGTGQYQGHQGLVCLTTTRLLFVDKGFITASLNQTEYPLSLIQTVSTRRSLGGETLVITSAGTASEIKNLMHGQAEEINRQIRRLQEAPSATTASTSVEHAEDPTDTLRKLADLRDQGIITEDEFAEKKQAILNRIV